MSAPRPERDNQWMAGAFGGLASITVAAALVPARSWLGPTNVALVLVVVVVAAAAVGGRAAGAMASVSGALALNFFHTRPYLTLRVTDRTELISVVLLLIAGLLVGELALLRTRSQGNVVDRDLEVRALRDAAHRAGAGDVDELESGIRSALIAGLALKDCRFERIEDQPVLELPMVDHSGRIRRTEQRYVHGGGFELPPEGVVIEVRHADQLLGHLVLIPEAGQGVSLDRRKLAVALADVLATALAGNPSRSNKE